MNEYIINHALITLQVLIYKNTYDITCILIHLNSTLSTQVLDMLYNIEYTTVRLIFHL